VRYTKIINQIIFIKVRVFEMRMYRTGFELTRNNASRESKIDDVSDNEK